MGAAVSLGTVLTDKVIVAAVAVCLSVLGLTGWLTFGRAANDGGTKPAARTVTVLRCPECGDVLPYSPAQDGTPCEVCGKGSGYAPVVQTESANGLGGWWSEMSVFLLVCLVLSLALTHLVVFRVGSLRRSAEEESHQRLVAYCPYCERKIGYSVTRVGAVHVCSRCKTAFALPTLAE